MHDYSAALAARQGEQINRLTVVSMIFLPLSAVTGFFGMNFDWLNHQLDSREAFWTLGVALPGLGVLGTTLWLWRRGLVRFLPQQKPMLAKALAMESQMSFSTPLAVDVAPAEAVDLKPSGASRAAAPRG